MMAPPRTSMFTAWGIVFAQNKGWAQTSTIWFNQYEFCDMKCGETTMVNKLKMYLPLQKSVKWNFPTVTYGHDGLCLCFGEVQEVRNTHNLTHLTKLLQYWNEFKTFHRRICVCSLAENITPVAFPFKENIIIHKRK